MFEEQPADEGREMIATSLSRVASLLVASTLVASLWLQGAGAGATETSTSTAPTTATSTPSTGSPSTGPPPTTTPGATPTSGGSDSTEVPESTVLTMPDGSPAVTNEDGTPVVTNADGDVVDLDDDLADGEAPGEEPPPPPSTSGRYAGQGDLRVEQVLVSDVRNARAKVAAAEDDHVAAISMVRSLRLRLKDLTRQKEALDADVRRTIEELTATEARLEARLLSAFVRGGAADLDGFGSVLDNDAALEHEAQQTLVDVVFDGDQELIELYREQRRRLDVEVLSLIDRLRIVSESLTEAEESALELEAAVRQAELELEAFEAGSQIYVHGVVFPIAWPYGLPLIDSWGFPRMLGSADAHWHEGIDIFAASGTPLLAAENGIVSRIGSGRLGGLRLWLRGDSGTDWYYAHLSGFAPNLREGQRVEAGDVVGYVGNTGNAVGTPPHLHMQIHPNGGDPVNPYPLLNIVSQREIAERSEAAATAAEG